MTCFDKFVNNCSKVDWQILMNGGISLYYKDIVLEKSLKLLSDDGYKFNEFDFGLFDTEKDFHRSIKKQCGFPVYYGENMSALTDCLRYDLEIPEKGGHAFVLKRFDDFYKRQPESAHEILERLALASRERMVTGERLITLVQTEDPLFIPKSVGEHNIQWNLHEFMEESRI